MGIAGSTDCMGMVDNKSTADSMAGSTDYNNWVDKQTATGILPGLQGCQIFCDGGVSHGSPVEFDTDCVLCRSVDIGCL